MRCGLLLMALLFLSCTPTDSPSSVSPEDSVARASSREGAGAASSQEDSQSSASELPSPSELLKSAEEYNLAGQLRPALEEAARATKEAAARGNRDVWQRALLLELRLLQAQELYADANERVEPLLGKIADLPKGHRVELAQILTTGAQAGVPYAGSEKQALDKAEEILKMKPRAEIGSDQANSGKIGQAARAAFALGEVYRKQGDSEKAIRAYDRALELIEEDEAIRMPLYPATLLAARPLWEARSVLAHLEQGQKLEALSIVEKGKWARWSSTIRAARAANLPASSQQKARNKAQEIRTLDRRLLARLGSSNSSQGGIGQNSGEPSGTGKDGSSAEGATETEDAAGKEGAETEDAAGKEGAEKKESIQKERADLWFKLDLLVGSPQTKLPRSLEPTALVGDLPDGELVLRYRVLPEVIVVWELRRGEAIVRQASIHRGELEKLVSTFADSCRRGAIETDSAKKLAALLLGNLAVQPPTKLTIIADGPLRSIPWSALPTAEGFLANSTSIRMLPGLFWKASCECQDSGKTVLFANPSGRIPAAQQEAQSLGSVLLEAEMLPGEKATRDVLVTRLSDTAILHFGAGLVRSTQGLPEALLPLARQDRLSPFEIQGLDMKGPIVFLSDHESTKNNEKSNSSSRKNGLGTPTAPIPLAESFLAAGARTVVANLWPQADGVGVEVSSLFYENLVMKELPVAEALHEAQKALIRGEGGDVAQSPSVWSAYVMMGKSERH